MTLLQNTRNLYTKNYFWLKKSIKKWTYELVCEKQKSEEASGMGVIFFFEGRLDCLRGTGPIFSDSSSSVSSPSVSSSISSKILFIFRIKKN